jgi:hypothetical protein
MRSRTAVLLSVLLLLAGCIAVKNYGVYWGTGTLDPALAGTWASTRAENGGSSVTFTAEDDNMYRMHFANGGNDKFVRTLKVADSTYLMTKLNPEDEGGTLIAYVIEGEDLAFFAPNRDKQKDFLKRYPTIPFSITKTTFTIEELTPETMKWLTKITKEPEWWIQIQRFTREK